MRQIFGEGQIFKLLARGVSRVPKTKTELLNASMLQYILLCRPKVISFIVIHS